MATNSTVPSLTVTEVQAAEVAKLWPAILYTSVMMAMGSVGNSIVCYVYGFRWQSTVTKTFIFSLAALDLTNSLICMPTEIAMLVKIMSFNAPWWCKVTRFLTYTLNGSSSLILAAIALDRWFKVCQPLKCFFTHKRAKWTCAGALLLAATLSWPSLILYGNLTLPIVGSSDTGVTCLVSDDFIDTWWPLVFYCVYFSCYLCLVVVITVLYSMIAVKLVQLKKKQKERIVAQYTGLRSSKVMFHSQETLPLTNAGLAEDETKIGVKGDMTDQANNGEAGKQTYPAVAKLQDLEKENERRKSVTFRLPRRSTSSEEKVPGIVGKNGIPLQTPEIVIDENTEEDENLDDKSIDTQPEKDGEKEDEDSVLDEGRGPYDSAEDLTLTENLIQSPERLDPAMTQSSDSLQAPECSESTQLLSTKDDRPHPSSPEDTDDFEQGIHFTPHNDLEWQHNPIIDPSEETCHTPDTNDDSHNDTKDMSSDTIDDDLGSKSSLLSGRSRERVAKTWSDSYALPVPRREGESGKNRIHKTSSDSNLVIPEKHQTLTSARRSFLMPPGGYPGGHTPTSRLPTPEGNASPISVEAKPTLLSSKLILERLNKKMAYRPAKTTRMLFAISIVFVISFLPFFCIVITRACQGRAFFASLTDAGVIAICIAIRSSFISNAANPIIYGLCNKQFRTECGFLFKKCSKKRRDVTLRVIEATDDVLGSNS